MSFYLFVTNTCQENCISDSLFLCIVCFFCFVFASSPYRYHDFLKQFIFCPFQFDLSFYINVKLLIKNTKIRKMDYIFYSHGALAHLLVE
jgi:hypothetical protein